MGYPNLTVDSLANMIENEGKQRKQREKRGCYGRRYLTCNGDVKSNKIAHGHGLCTCSSAQHSVAAVSTCSTDTRLLILQ